jgi:hypothetical protein
VAGHADNGQQDDMEPILPGEIFEEISVLAGLSHEKKDPSDPESKG